MSKPQQSFPPILKNYSGRPAHGPHDQMGLGLTKYDIAFNNCVTSVAAVLAGAGFSPPVLPLTTPANLAAWFATATPRP